MRVKLPTTVQVTKFTPKIETAGKTPRRGDGACSDKAHGVCNYETPPRKVPSECAHGVGSRRGLGG